MAYQKCVCGSYTRLTVESKSRIWPSFGCCRSHKWGLPCGRLWFHGSSDPVLYVLTILDMWVQGLFDTKAHIPPAVELKVAYMAKFWVPSFPQTRASLWHIMILLQFGPRTVCTSHIGSVCQRAIWYTQLYIPPCCGMKNRVYCAVCGALVPTIEAIPVTDYAFMAVWTPNCMNQTYWVRGSKGYVVHKAHIPPAVELKGAIWPSLGCLRSHKRERSCGRLGFYGSLDPKLYVQAILGLWVYRLFGTAHITLAVEWKITFIAKFGVPSSPPSRASLLWNEKSRLLPSLGCPCSHNRGCNCGRLCYLVHIAHIPALMWNQNRVYGLVWDILLRDWKPLWETSTCVGRLIYPEGYVSKDR